MLKGEGLYMSHKIQITVDDQLNETIKNRAEQIGLSISSYARFVLKNFVAKKGDSLLDEAIKDLKANNVESLTLAEFNRQIDDL
jgi:antitoxin component of RelBE/YafQ-DinJ toxin-antitoxin module